MPDPVRLYDEDFVRWTEEQAQVLRDAARAGANLPLDWEHLAEEVEDLGRSLRRELRSRLATVIEHLLKLECSSASEPRRGWSATVRRERQRIELLLEDAPSLRRDVGPMIAKGGPPTVDLVMHDFLDRGETTQALHARMRDGLYSERQVLGDWFPVEPGNTAA